MTSDTDALLALTPAAASRILSEADAADLDEALIRFAARIGDDGVTVEYAMGFDERREQDMAFETDGVTILVSPPSRELLAGVTVDFVEIAPGEQRFIFARAQPEAAADGRPGANDGTGERGDDVER